MKPIIIYAEEKDGKVTITKDELQRIVDEAYRQGKADSWHSCTTPVIDAVIDDRITITNQGGTA